MTDPRHSAEDRPIMAGKISFNTMRHESIATDTNRRRNNGNLKSKRLKNWREIVGFRVQYMPRDY